MRPCAGGAPRVSNKPGSTHATLTTRRRSFGSEHRVADQAVERSQARERLLPLGEVAHAARGERSPRSREPSSRPPHARHQAVGIAVRKRIAEQHGSPRRQRSPRPSPPTPSAIVITAAGGEAWRAQQPARRLAEIKPEIRQHFVLPRRSPKRVRLPRARTSAAAIASILPTARGRLTH